MVRLGGYYRRLVLARLGICPEGPLALDVGAHDGSVLVDAPGVRVIRLDLAPERGNANIRMVRADGKRPPFQPGAFASVFALDVLEHEPDDRALMAALLELLAPDGTLYLSMPSREYRAVPGFLTTALHRRWGHVRPGYSPEELRSLLPNGWSADIHEWNEPGFRVIYFPARLLWGWAPRLARLLLRWAAVADVRSQKGQCGHLYARIARSETRKAPPP
ncbi:MAG: class I SAM-dependent methyltransferase [Chloroflexi bacterium]|nr:class I SAM-dependent methyltransferase [Chloroflexota bacterium]